jgi:hypothetical protein
MQPRLGDESQSPSRRWKRPSSASAPRAKSRNRLRRGHDALPANAPRLNVFSRPISDGPPAGMGEGRPSPSKGTRVTAIAALDRGAFQRMAPFAVIEHAPKKLRNSRSKAVR